MSAYWKRVDDGSQPPRFGDFCYFTDEQMTIIYWGVYDEKAFKKYSEKSYEDWEIMPDVVFWCKPNQIKSNWGVPLYGE